MDTDGAGGAYLRHTIATRSLAFDLAGQLYILVGSMSNADSYRARIRRIPAAVASISVPVGGYDFQATEVFADLDGVIGPT